MKVNGPGKYDEVCTIARELTQAHGVVLIILSGNRGTGFSGQFSDACVAQVDIPRWLREMAEQIEGMQR